ncbi:MAG TPA: cytochrome c maturation protein CcmE [Polyangiaceae bacterium]|nr:cytochrome c maturation protein CcmE [Polyangiaceae bacterium]
MSDLDKELEQAAAAVDEPAPPVVRPAAEYAPPPRKGNVGLLIGLLVMCAAILSLLAFSFDKSAAYAKEVDELLREKDKYPDRSVRVQGTLVKGTLVRRDQPCEYRFELEDLKSKGVKMPVRYAQCIVPDTFKDMPGMDVMVTAEGKLESDGHFQASNIFAKCPSKYEMKEMQKGGAKAPHLSQMAQTL